MTKPNSTGYIIDEETRDALHDVIKDDDLDTVAREVGVSAITLCKALGGHPVSAMTVLNVQRYVDELDDESDLDEDENSESEESEDEEESDLEDDAEDAA